VGIGSSLSGGWDGAILEHGTRPIFQDFTFKKTIKGIWSFLLASSTMVAKYIFVGIIW